jgi:hypothetical protein
MTLQVVKSGTNWSPKDLQVLQRMKKNYAEMDDQSGRPWKLGDDLLLVDPPGDEGIHTGRYQRLEDAAKYIRCSPVTLRSYGMVADAWPADTRVSAVGYSVFRALMGAPDRVKILRKLIGEFGAENITQDDARRAVGTAVSSPTSLFDRAVSYRTYLSKFRGQRLTAKSRLALEQLRLEIDVLLGEAEEEAV